MKRTPIAFDTIWALDLRIDAILEAMQSMGIEIRNVYATLGQRQTVGLTPLTSTLETSKMCLVLVNGGGHPPHDVLARFLKLKPSRFNGEKRPNDTKNWTLILKHIFKAITNTNVEKIRLVAVQFDGNAYHRWQATKTIAFLILGMEN